MPFRCSRRQSMIATGSLLLSAGCISIGSPSRGRLEVNTSRIDYSVSIAVTSPDETVLDETFPLNPDNPIEASFLLEQDTEYNVQIEFEPVVQAININDSAAEQGWTAESGIIHGEVGYSSSNQVYTVSIDDTGEASIEYAAVGVP